MASIINLVNYDYNKILCLATQIARQVLKCELGIEYQPGGQTLDIYYPSNINGVLSIN